MNEVEALSILTATPLLGSIKIRILIDRFGSASEALAASKEAVFELPGFGNKICERWEWWNRDESWKKNLDIAERMGVSLLSYRDPAYPKNLLELTDYPLLLYIKGSLHKNDHNGIAVIGTRNATIYGKEQTQRFSSSLAAAGFTIVSGLARGVDTLAHEAACQKGRTVAVLGSGIGNIYPKENGPLAERIAERGAVVSEYSMLTPPDRQHFPQRNRIVSGMTLGTLLIEAPLDSGAMITMSRAQQQKRKMWAIPGRCDYENFAGNHQLIREGSARLVEKPEDIFSCFDNLFVYNRLEERESSLEQTLEKEEVEFLKQLPVEEINIETIVQLTKLPMMKINVLLMGLVIKQVIKEYPGKIYKKSGLQI